MDERQDAAIKASCSAIGRKEDAEDGPGDLIGTNFSEAIALL